MIPQNPTTQELLNYIVAELKAQGEPSVSIVGCAYRGDNGRKCAVGHVISDVVYCEDLEALTIEHEIVDNAVSESIGRDLTDADVAMLDVLQATHDNTVDAIDWYPQFCIQAVQNFRQMKVGLDTDLDLDLDLSCLR